MSCCVGQRCGLNLTHVAVAVVKASSHSPNQTPSLGTSKCHGCGTRTPPKKKEWHVLATEQFHQPVFCLEYFRSSTAFFHFILSLVPVQAGSVSIGIKFPRNLWVSHICHGELLLAYTIHTSSPKAYFLSLRQISKGHWAYRNRTQHERKKQNRN